MFNRHNTPVVIYKDDIQWESHEPAMDTFAGTDQHGFTRAQWRVADQAAQPCPKFFGDFCPLG